VLSVFETTEVFLELAGLKFGGPAGRWAVIVAVQVNNLIIGFLVNQCGGSGMFIPDPGS
jgi:hypothetical protein